MQHNFVINQFHNQAVFTWKTLCLRVPSWNDGRPPPPPPPPPPPHVLRLDGMNFLCFQSENKMLPSLPPNQALVVEKVNIVYLHK